MASKNICGATDKLVKTNEHPLQIDTNDEIIQPFKKNDTMNETVQKNTTLCSDIVTNRPEIVNSKNFTVISDNNANVDVNETPDAKCAKDFKNVSKIKRVTFPEGKEVVSGYMDPPIPWHDASTCTTEKLVRSYLRSCEKFGLKFIPKILKQLQVINNFEARNETFMLKNDYLDHKHCETLEEIFKRVQFRTIDLEGTRIDDEAAVTIFEMIEYYESCIKLNISFNKGIGYRGWQSCSRLLRKASCLQHLDIRATNISEHLMPFMARALKIGTSLTCLHMEYTMPSGKPLNTLALALKGNETLRELYLGDNRLVASDAAQLAGLLRHNKTISLLDLRNNNLQDVGLGHLCDGLCSGDSYLETLILWNNQITYHSMTALSRVLMVSKSLQGINLGHNNLGNEGIHRLKDGLLRNKILIKVGMQGCKIFCEGAVAIAEYIAETRSLLRLDLRENDIKTAGLMALSLSMKVNQSVVRVDLDKEYKKESGVKDYADQQKRLLSDLFNYVDRNCKLSKQREEEEKEKKLMKLSQMKQEQQEQLKQTEQQQRPDVVEIDKHKEDDNQEDDKKDFLESFKSSLHTIHESSFQTANIDGFEVIPRQSETSETSLYLSPSSSLDRVSVVDASLEADITKVVESINATTIAPTGEEFNLNELRLLQATTTTADVNLNPSLNKDLSSPLAKSKLSLDLLHNNNNVLSMSLLTSPTTTSTDPTFELALTENMKVNVPPSPMVLSRGYSSLVPVNSLGVTTSPFSPTAGFGDFSVINEEDFNYIELSPEEHGLVGGVDEQLVRSPLSGVKKKQSGKIHKEKRHKFIVTSAKISGHHHHHHPHHTHTPKKISTPHQSTTTITSNTTTTTTSASLAISDSLDKIDNTNPLCSKYMEDNKVSDADSQNYFTTSSKFLEGENKNEVVIKKEDYDDKEMLKKSDDSDDLLREIDYIVPLLCLSENNVTPLSSSLTSSHSSALSSSSITADIQTVDEPIEETISNCGIDFDKSTIKSDLFEEVRINESNIDVFGDTSFESPHFGIVSSESNNNIPLQTTSSSKDSNDGTTMNLSAEALDCNQTPILNTDISSFEISNTTTPVFDTSTDIFITDSLINNTLVTTSHNNNNNNYLHKNISSKTEANNLINCDNFIENSPQVDQMVNKTPPVSPTSCTNSQNSSNENDFFQKQLEHIDLEQNESTLSSYTGCDAPRHTNRQQTASINEHLPHNISIHNSTCSDRTKIDDIESMHLTNAIQSNLEINNNISNNSFSCVNNLDNSHNKTTPFDEKIISQTNNVISHDEKLQVSLPNGLLKSSHEKVST